MQRRGILITETHQHSFAEKHAKQQKTCRNGILCMLRPVRLQTRQCLFDIIRSGATSTVVGACPLVDFLGRRACRGSTLRKGADSQRATRLTLIPVVKCFSINNFHNSCCPNFPTELIHSDFPLERPFHMATAESPQRYRRSGVSPRCGPSCLPRTLHVSCRVSTCATCGGSHGRTRAAMGGARAGATRGA